MERPVEERQPMSDERRADGVVEKRPNRLVRGFAFEQEDSLGLRQEDGVPVESCVELRATENRMLGKKLLRSLTNPGLQAGNEDEPIHGGSLLGASIACPLPGREPGCQSAKAGDHLRFLVGRLTLTGASRGAHSSL